MLLTIVFGKVSQVFFYTYRRKWRLLFGITIRIDNFNKKKAYCCCVSIAVRLSLCLMLTYKRLLHTASCCCHYCQHQQLQQTGVVWQRPGLRSVAEVLALIISQWQCISQWPLLSLALLLLCTISSTSLQILCWETSRQS